MRCSRRRAVQLATHVVLSGAAASGLGCALDRRREKGTLSDVVLRRIPASGEYMSAVGLGTSSSFTAASGWPGASQDLRNLVSRFVELGGRLIDTCPCYGSSEQVVGDIARRMQADRSVLWAAKISGAYSREAAGLQMMRSRARLASDQVFLYQLHNLTGGREHLALLREWRAQGYCKYIGLTIANRSQFTELVQLIDSEPLDFVQCDYAVDNRWADEVLAPLLQERGLAWIANQPFGRGRLLQRVKGVHLPAWAEQLGADSWAQLFIKWILGNPAVTATIPSTANIHHLEENMEAGTGDVPTEEWRNRIAAAVDAM